MKSRLYRRDYRNALVLARMRVAEHVAGDVEALPKLAALPFEEVLVACFEILDAPDDTLDT